MFKRLVTGRMRVRNRLWALALALGLSMSVLLVYAGAVFATHDPDNITTTNMHRHLKGMTYHYLSSVPVDWYYWIDLAAWGWDALSPTVSITHDILSNNWILYVQYPPAVALKCDAMWSYACTDRYLEGAHNNTFHMIYTDIYLNNNANTNPNWTFTFSYDYDNCKNDATLEGFLHPDITETVAHEFGHAVGWLNHSTNGGDVMAAGTTPGCWRYPNSHDLDNMAAQYAGHP